MRKEVPLRAQAAPTINLFSNTTALAVDGSAEVTATLVDSEDAPVRDGVLVTFTTSLGTLEPREARTRDGKATVRLLAGNHSGVARVSAFSGSTQANDLEIRIGAAAAEAILLSFTPGSLPVRGGTVQLMAAVVDASGNPVPAVPITFTTNAGTLATGTVITDRAGEARNSLTTNRPTTVTARGRNKEATIAIRVNTAPRISIKADPLSPLVGQPTFFNVTVDADSTSSRIQRVTIDFGDRTSVNLGALTGTTTVSHTYRSADAYTVTVSVTDTGGEQTWQATVITVRGLLAVTVSANPMNPSVGQPVSLTASVNSRATLIQSYEWDFDAKKAVGATTTSNQTTHVYTTPGAKVVRVTVMATDGTAGVGQLAVIVTP